MLKLLKKIGKVWLIYNLVTGYFYLVSEQFMLISEMDLKKAGDAEYAENTYHREFTWKVIFNRFKIWWRNINKL